MAVKMYPRLQRSPASFHRDHPRDLDLDLDRDRDLRALRGREKAAR